MNLKLLYLRLRKLVRWYITKNCEPHDCTTGPGCSKHGQRYPPGKKITIQRIEWFVLLTLIHEIAICMVDSAIHALNDWTLNGK